MNAGDRKYYSENEKLLLLSLVENYSHIVENKNTDGVSAKKKQEVWDMIAKMYNANEVIPRTNKQLKKLWENIKQR